MTSGLTYFNSYAQTVRFRLGLVELAPDSTGGAATYGRAMREILSRLSGDLSFDLIRLVNESSKSSISGLDDSVVTYRKWAPPVSPWRRLFSGAVSQSQKQKGQSLPQVLEHESIDLVWFLAPNQVIEQVRDVPFVMTVWDLAHREVQGFPEFNSGRGWSRRESWYANNIGRAFHVVTDSTHTGKSLEKIYGLYSHNWSAVGLPFPPEIEVDRALARSINLPYFYYPASFWPHKNHKVLIDALVRLLDQTVALVFTGTDEGMEDALKRYAEAQGVSNRVKFLGRVTDSEVQGLIAGSLGVLMPSKLGPTNYPPLEALRLGVPCVVSTAHDFDELPDGVFGRAEPDDSEQWAQEMSQMVVLRRAVRPLDGANESAREKVRGVLASFKRARDTHHWE